MNPTHSLLKASLFLALMSVLVASSDAQEATPILVVDGLNNPTGVAIQPETGTVFVAESGAQRVVRIDEGRAKAVITGFGKDAYGKGPIYPIGPLGLLFLNEKTLIVGGGGYPDGEDKVYGFKIPDDEADSINADGSELGSKTLAKTDERVGEGNFYALAKGNKGIYVTCNGDDTKGWISRITYNAEYRLTGFARSFETVKPTKTTAPVAITISPQGHVTVGQMGKIDAEPDSLLSFYSEDGAHLDSFKTGLHDISGLAYGPKHGRLFATDFNWTDSKRGGLFKIIGTKDKQGCKSKLIATLQRPTALAFASNGDLYVTLAGDPTKEKPDGKLVVFKEMDIDNSK